MPIFALPLALFALSALPVLATVYFLSSRYRRREVSSLLLWPKDALPKGGGRKTSRFRSSRLLLLELLILLLLALAAAGPLLGLAAGRRTVCVVLDDRVSMRAHDGGAVSARMRAVAALKKELANLGRFEARFVVAGPQPRAVGAATSLEEVERLLGDAAAPQTVWPCLSETGDLSAALTLVGQTAPPGAVVLVFSDRRAPEQLPAAVRWQAVGLPLANMGITAAARGKQDQVHRALIEVANFSTAAATAQLSLEQADGAGGWQSAGSVAVPLAGGARETVVLPNAGTRSLRVRLGGSDALAEDDSVLLLPEPERVLKAKVEVADAKLQQALGQALKAIGVAEGTQGAHLLITDQAPAPVAGAKPPENPSAVPAVPAAVEPSAPLPNIWELRLETGKEKESHQAFTGPFILNRSHPLTRGLSLEGVVWGVPPAGLAVHGDDEEIIGLGDRSLLVDRLFPGGEHRLRMVFAPWVSTLDQTPAFPILLANLADWRLDHEPGLRRSNWRQGEAVRVAVPVSLTGSHARVWQLTAPDAPPSEWRGGPVFELPASRPGAHVFGALGADGAKYQWPFQVNLCNAEASDLREAASAQAGQWPAEVKTEGRFKLAFVLILLALGLLMLHAHWVKKGAEQ